ncbi:MAG TPA: DUF1592 domain-containing protein [Acidobacteriota bacterium]|nr:DUF1592 domain-containing protein [Acidobacteriota bacterium]
MRSARLLMLLMIPQMFFYSQAVSQAPNSTMPAPALAATPPGSAAPIASNPPAPGEIIDAYCVFCHNQELRTAGLTLDAIDLENVAPDAEVLEKVWHMVRTGQMPPPQMPRPDQETLSAMVAWLEEELDEAAAADPNPGRVGIHRLNRTEYTNAVRDLLAVEIDAKLLLLSDEADEGFDNIAESLTISPAHLERYLSAARTVSRLAVGDPTLGAVPSSKLHKLPVFLNQDGRVSEGQPFGSRGGLAVRHNFELDGEYVIKVLLRRQIYSYIVGLRDAQQLDVRIDGERVARFTVGGEGREKGRAAPLTWAGEIRGEIEWENYVHSADSALEARVPVRAGARTVSVSFVQQPRELEEVLQPRSLGFGFMSDQLYDGLAAVESVGIAGPYRAEGPGDTPSRRHVFVCRPTSPADETPCARTILSRLARRAYRRPVTDGEVQTLIDFYEAGRSAGGFDSGIQAAIERLLVSVNFLLRIDNPPPGAAPGRAYRLTDLDLASRLSFFLWSSIPDEELLDLAIRGQLSQPTVLEDQASRMLADPRSRMLVDDFASQWLGYGKALAWQPDSDLFFEFDENLRHAFLKETELFVDSQLREDHSVLELLTADYTFVNERLAEHYGIPGITGERFRRVTLDDGVRGGLLGQGSILMVTSYPDRTAPVVRGRWLLENILGMPPPPPPESVPDLVSTASDGRALSMKEQMELHRENPACATCHIRMDPLGFALENFDAVGRWRTAANGVPVDASSVFADGTPIDGVPGIRKLLSHHRENFVRTFTAKLLTYALGRGVEYYDNPAIRKILRRAADTDYRWSSIIRGIIESEPFQMGRAPLLLERTAS